MTIRELLDRQRQDHQPADVDSPARIAYRIARDIAHDRDGARRMMAHSAKERTA